jgi:hypothetical protein
LLVQGLAWIDATSHEMLRIQTDLLAPRPDMGLEKMTTVIEFSSVRLPETTARFQLPTKAVVDVTLDGPKFQSIHEYSDFKLFRVESRIGGSPQN